MTSRQIVHRKGPVGWFSLRLLYKSGLLALVSQVSDGRSARREVLAALDQSPVTDKLISQDDGTVWFDYVADTGDSFDATYSIAWLIGRDHVFVGNVGQPVTQPIPSTQKEAPSDLVNGAAIALPAGRALIFGGDQVYPYSAGTEYEDRCTGPYAAARPWDLRGPEPCGRKLFAIPGNHDWYDGLGGFVRLFCQSGRWNGAWQAAQSRSYFAVEAGHGFWIWGADVVSDDEYDAPQLRFFEERARALKAGDQVVLCLPKPAWVEPGAASPQVAKDATRTAWHKLDLLEKMITDSKGRVAAFIAGDLHHFAHYATHPKSPEGEQHFISCGGGGAYLLGTQALRDEIDLTDPDTGTKRKAAFKNSYPSRQEAKTMWRGLARFPLNFIPFCTAFAMCLLITTALIVDALYISPYPFVDTFLLAPARLAILAGVWLGLVRFAVSSRAGQKTAKSLLLAILAGSLHFLIQVGIVFLFQLALQSTGWGIGTRFIVATVLGVPLFAVLSGWVFAAYLLVANKLIHLHDNEIFSAQSIKDYKCFLRVRVDAGGMTIYPIGLKNVCTDWVKAPDVCTAPDPMAKSADAQPAPGLKTRDTYLVEKGMSRLIDPEQPLMPHLIATPIRIDRDQERSHAA